jgi:Mor family transcriptional regulator
LAEVQKYLSGELLYIPKTDEKAEWGSVSGWRERLDERNGRIAASYRQGVAVSVLVDEFCLSEASIRKIIYSNKELRQIKELTKNAG